MKALVILAALFAERALAQTITIPPHPNRAPLYVGDVFQVPVRLLNAQGVTSAYLELTSTDGLKFMGYNDRVLPPGACALANEQLPGYVRIPMLLGRGASSADMPLGIASYQMTHPGTAYIAVARYQVNDQPARGGSYMTVTVGSAAAKARALAILAAIPVRVQCTACPQVDCEECLIDDETFGADSGCLMDPAEKPVSALYDMTFHNTRSGHSVTVDARYCIFTPPLL